MKKVTPEIIEKFQIAFNELVDRYGDSTSLKLGGTYIKSPQVILLDNQLKLFLIKLVAEEVAVNDISAESILRVLANHKNIFMIECDYSSIENVINNLLE